MSWPRKNETARIYRDKDKKTFFVVWVDETTPGYGWDAVANVLTGDTPSLGSCGIPPGYVARHFLKRFEWSELSKEWQDAILFWLNADPKTIRGFWRMNNQPV